MNEARDYILRIDCPDRPGIVAEVAGALRDHDCNIEDSAQFFDKLSGRFFMRTVFRPLDGPGMAQAFLKSFAAIAGHFSMVWHVNAAAEKPRTLILVSKADHCLNDILYRWRTGHLPIDIAAIVSNHPDIAPVARERGLPFVHLPVSDASRAGQEAQIMAMIDGANVELIVLARYMQVLSAQMCDRYPGRIVNIHHSFLPGFKGAKPYHQAWERGVKIIGATAHFATRDLDDGPIIEQETARIDHTMDPARLQILGQDIECRVLSRALACYCERRIFLHGNRTIIL